MFGIIRTQFVSQKGIWTFNALCIQKITTDYEAKGENKTHE
jgi:hypothetical protein